MCATFATPRGARRVRKHQTRHTAVDHEQVEFRHASGDSTSTARPFHVATAPVELVRHGSRWFAGNFAVAPGDLGSDALSTADRTTPTTRFCRAPIRISLHRRQAACAYHNTFLRTAVDVARRESEKAPSAPSRTSFNYFTELLQMSETKA